VLPDVSEVDSNCSEDDPWMPCSDLISAPKYLQNPHPKKTKDKKQTNPQNQSINSTSAWRRNANNFWALNLVANIHLTLLQQEEALEEMQIIF
jgi:hypothetical protein